LQSVLTDRIDEESCPNVAFSSEPDCQLVPGKKTIALNIFNHRGSQQQDKMITKKIPMDLSERFSTISCVYRYSLPMVTHDFCE
jgi:hypothetical protein